jgi:hypothetical protein
MKMKVYIDFHCDYMDDYPFLNLNTDYFDRGRTLHIRSAFSIDMFGYIQYYITLQNVIEALPKSLLTRLYNL